MTDDNSSVELYNVASPDFRRGHILPRTDPAHWIRVRRDSQVSSASCATPPPIHHAHPAPSPPPTPTKKDEDNYPRQQLLRRLSHLLHHSSVKYVMSISLCISILAIGAGILYILESAHQTSIRNSVRQSAEIAAHSITNQLFHGLSVTFALAAMVQQRIDFASRFPEAKNSNTPLSDFDDISSHLMSVYEGIYSLGVISNASVQSYPPGTLQLPQIHGFDEFDFRAFLNETYTYTNLVVVGPYRTPKRGDGTLGPEEAYETVHVAGLYPIFSNTSVKSPENFWGITMCDVLVPSLLNASLLQSQLSDKGLNFWLSTVDLTGTLHEDDSIDPTITTIGAVGGGVIGAFAANTFSLPQHNPLAVPVEVPGGRWVIIVEPEEGWQLSKDLWYEGLIVVVLAILCPIIFFLILRQPGILRAAVKRRTQELEQAREELEQKNQALLKIDETKDQFMANTSHELRTPLMGIIGVADSLLEGTSGPIANAAQVEMLQLIRSSGKRLSDLVNDILDFESLKCRNSKMQLRLHVQPVDVTHLIHDLLKMSVVPANKNIQLHLDIAQPVPLVMADEQRLQQIVYNLVDNAIKYSDRGDVTVTVSLVKLQPDVSMPVLSGAELPPAPCLLRNCRSLSEPVPMVQVEVADTGVGIDPEDLARIFMDFERLNPEQVRGAGLGLSICKMLVELHGSKIEVRSAPGVGSRFSFRLPLYEGSPERIPKRGATLVGRMHVQPSSRRDIVPAVSPAEAKVTLPQPDPPTLDGEAIMTTSNDSTDTTISSDGGSTPGGPEEKVAPLTLPDETVTSPRRVRSASTPAMIPMRYPPLHERTLAPIPEGVKRSILVIDDEEVNRRVLSQYLKANFSVSLAHDGFEGLKMLDIDMEGGEQANQFSGGLPPYALVLLDINMPKMDGYEVCRRIREMYAPWQLPVLLITAQNRATNIVEGFKVRANDYLQKPITRGELVARVEFHLEQASFTQNCFANQHA